jgi:hypothetical protein
MHSTIALSGGFRYSPTTSRILASSSGSVENLNVCTRHGCSPHFFHVVDTVKSLMPRCLASSRLDQCVTPKCGGGGSNVASTMLTGSITGGRPDFGRSSNPAIPSAA